MADIKISALPVSTTPLAGSEVLPIVQGNTTKQVSIANVTAGRAISASTVQATTTIGVGAAAPSASGAGITFPATASLSTNANTLDDYEEGLFTSVITPNTSGTITLIAGFDQLSYTKIGRTVLMQGQLKVDSVSSPVGTFVKISLPFAIATLSTVAGRFGTSVVSDIAAGVNNLYPTIGVSGDSFVSVYLTAANVAANRSFYVGFSYTTTV
jgi:hypothetical protein